MHRVQTLEETVQKAVTERPQTVEDHSLPPLEPCIPPVPPLLPVEMPTPGPMPFWHGPEIYDILTMTPVLQDVSSRANIVYSPPVGIASDIVNLALQGCRSRRNLAARLAAKLYTLRERTGSNCRGKQGRTALDQGKLKAIFSAYMQYFPLQCLETQLIADKEM